MEELDDAGVWIEAARDLLADLSEKYLESSDPAAIDEGIALAEHMLAGLAPSAPLREYVALDLAVDYTERYRLTGNTADLDRGIELGRASLTTSDSSLRATAVNNLAARLLASWQQEASQEHLNEAITLLEHALSDFTPGDTERARMELNLGAAYSARSDHLGCRGDLDRAIDLTRSALPYLSLAERGGGEAHLGSMLVGVGRYDDLERRLDEAVSVARLATTRPATRLERARRLHSFAQVSLSAFEALGEIESLEEAESAIRRARRAAPAHAPIRPGLLSTHAAVAASRYEHTGDRSTLNQAITYATKAARWPNLSAPDRGAFANELALLLTDRFRLIGNRADLDRAATLLGDALDQPVGADAEPILRTNLAHVLETRFSLDGEPADLDAAIDQIEQALATTTASSSERASRLDAAGIYAQARAELRQDEDDLQQAIEFSRTAVAASEPASPAYAGYLSNLANRLDTRAEWHASREDLNEAITLLEEAHALAPVGSTTAARIAFTLAGRYARRYQRYTLRDGVSDIQRAADLWDEVCGHGEPSLTVFAGQHLGNVAFNFEKWDECEQALSLSLEAARQLTEARREVGDRERARFDVQGTAAVAALAAVRAHNLARAILHLELGAATLLAEAAGRPAQHVQIAEVFSAARRLDAPIAYLAATPSGGVIVVAFPEGSLTHRELPLTTAEIQDALASLRRAFEADYPGDPLQEWSQAVEELLAWTYHSVAEQLATLVGAPSRLVLVPTGRLAALPIAAARLPSAPPLLEQSTVVVLPYARAGLSLPTPEHPRVFIAADPGPPSRYCDAVYEEAELLATVHANARIWTRRRSPHGTQGRHRSLRAHDIALDHRAARRLPGWLRDGLREATIVHLACHVDLDFDDPYQSSLQLGRPIHLEHIARRAPRGAHIVLSACDAGLNGNRLPDEALGPAPILLHAGARSVCAALWPIDDTLAPAFMLAYHRNIGAGNEPALALALAQRAFTHEPPIVWAAFTHVGT